MSDHAPPTDEDCDCMIPYLEGVGNHSPGCRVFRAPCSSCGTRRWASLLGGICEVCRGRVERNEDE